MASHTTFDEVASEIPQATFSRSGNPLETLRKRADFLAAARAKRHGTIGVHLQARPRGDDDPARVGFTCSKKVGNAVARNRAKRRLREIARLILPHEGRAGWDYVLVGRANITANRDFNDLGADFQYALKRVHDQ
jgi:ribonuclease P protein component